MYSLDPILELMRELDDAKVELDEINESGDLEERLEASLKVEELENLLLIARLKSC